MTKFATLLALAEAARRTPPEVIQVNRDKFERIVQTITDPQAAVAEIRKVVQQHFDSIQWSLEQEEWNKLSDDQKLGFCEAVYKHFRG